MGTHIKAATFCTTHLLEGSSNNAFTVHTHGTIEQHQMNELAITPFNLGSLGQVLSVICKTPGPSQAMQATFKSSRWDL